MMNAGLRSIIGLPRAVMLRVSKLIGGNLTFTRNYNKYDFAQPDTIYTQIPRRMRKPPWFGTAKSKLFRVRQRPVIPIEEVLEIQRLYNNYRTYMRSITSYLKEFAAQKEVGHDQEAIDEEKETDFLRCTAINDEWNAKLAQIREVRLADERERRKEKIAQIILKKEEEHKAMMKEIDEKIREKKATKFITAENIDEAIEKALINVTSYNVAVDAKGNFYSGKFHQTTSLPTSNPTD